MIPIDGETVTLEIYTAKMGNHAIFIKLPLIYFFAFSLFTDLNIVQKAFLLNRGYRCQIVVFS